MKIGDFDGNGRRFASGIVHSSTQCLMTVPITTTMRTDPSVTFDEIHLHDGNTAVRLDSVNTIRCYTSNVYVIGVHDQTLTLYRPAQFRNILTNGYMDFDSEL